MDISSFFSGLLAPLYAAFQTIDPTENFLVLIVLSVVAFSMVGIILKFIFKKEF